MNRNLPTSPGFPDPSADEWVDPDEERARLRRNLRRTRFGFSTLGLALVIASLMSIAWLIVIFTGRGQPLGLLIRDHRWKFLEESAVVWGTVIGAGLIRGQWAERNWQRRSGLLLLMCLVDVALWSLDHATDLGLSEGKFGHDWFRSLLGQALGWSEFALIASLSADMAAHLGERQAVDFGRAARSISSTGALVWFMFFYFQTDWNPPFWPLRQIPPNPGSMMLALGSMVLFTINLVQVSALTLLAGRSCGRALREMAAEDRRLDLPPSRSEAGWDEFTRSGSGPE